MTNLLLFDPKEQPLAFDEIERVFKSVEGFGELRYNTPVGTPIEADYARNDDSTIVRLNSQQTTISISGTSDASFHAAFALQKCLRIPLRIVDTNYSFDLILKDYSDFEELLAAVERAQAG